MNIYSDLPKKNRLIDYWMIISISLMLLAGIIIWYSPSQQEECTITYIEIPPMEISLNTISQDNQSGTLEIVDLYINIDDIINKTENPKIYLKDEWLQ